MVKKLIHFGRPLPPDGGEPISRQPDWVQADPAKIHAKLQRALALPSGGWYVVDASRSLREQPRRVRIRGRDLVAWRTAQGPRLAPDACPHMGASLAEGSARNGELVCPWHGLRLGRGAHGSWQPLPTFDDGVLTWVRLDGAEAPTDRPVLPPRPARYLDGVIRMEADCAPEDVLANRLDPWHGTHFHPYAFGRLKVTRDTEDCLQVRVAYRVAGPLAVEVDATFHCPDSRSIVMTIVDGDGKGSVVETHATPIERGRTAIIEATLATSDRIGFGWARRAAPALRPLMELAARRLWVDDAAYAERRYALRNGAVETMVPLAKTDAGDGKRRSLEAAS